MKSEIHLNIRRETDITPAVLTTGEYCGDLGFGETDQRMVATVVSELAHNIVKYSDWGTIRLREVTNRLRRGIEVIAEDSGQGIADVDLAMQDAYSSSGTLGHGLPGVKRMMDEFELHSSSGVGTTVRTRKWI